MVDGGTHFPFLLLLLLFSSCQCKILRHIFKSRNNEPDIEMKVMQVGEEVDMAASVDKTINEMSAENSMVSIENANSIIGNSINKIQKEKQKVAKNPNCRRVFLQI